MRTVITAVVAVAVFVVLGLIVNHGGPVGIDKAAFDVLDPIRGRTGLDILRVLTDAGSWPVIAVVSLAGALAAENKKDAIFLIGGTLALLILVDATKQIWDRPRPIGRFYKAEDYHQQYDEKTGRHSCPLPRRAKGA